jgi:hypothetical protein
MPELVQLPLPSEFSSLVYYFVARLGDKIVVIVLYCYSVSFFRPAGRKKDTEGIENGRQAKVLSQIKIKHHDYNMKQYHVSPRLSCGTLLAFSDSL